MIIELTDKERVLVKALFKTDNITQLAESIDVPYNTLRQRLHRLYKKCGVKGVQGLVNKYLRGDIA